MGRPRLDQAKPDRVVHQPLLEFVLEEPHHTVGMDALDREGRRFNHVAKEIGRVRKVVGIAVLLTLSLQSYEAEGALTSALRGRSNEKSFPAIEESGKSEKNLGSPTPNAVRPGLYQ